jgi:hypothetical protein
VLKIQGRLTALRLLESFNTVKTGGSTLSAAAPGAAAVHFYFKLYTSALYNQSCTVVTYNSTTLSKYFIIVEYHKVSTCLTTIL